MQIIITSLFFLVLFKSEANDTTQFGRNDAHTLSYKTSLVDQVQNIQITKDAPFNKASWPMPLIYKNIIYFGDKENNLLAYDLGSKKTLWKIPLNKARLHGAPYLSIEKNKLYFVSAEWRELTKAQTKFKYEIHTFINQINLDGSGLLSFEINHGLYLNPKQKLKIEDPNKLLHCKTSLGLTKKTAAGLYFGCSMYTYAGFGIYNRESQGVRGLLYFIPLEKNGNINIKAATAYTPSKVNNAPDSGFDTGIWNAGAGPTELDDGSIILATGNGPLDKKGENFGCSVIRIDPLTKKIKNVLTADTNTFNECDFNGLDFSSSSLALYKNQHTTQAFITNKGGDLLGFNPYSFSNEKLFFRIHFSHSSFGEPLVYSDKQDEIHVLASGYDKKYNHPPIEFIAPETMQAEFKNYEIKKCIGYLKKGTAPDSLLNLYYSGPNQDEYLLSKENVPIKKFERRVFVNQMKAFRWRKATPSELNQYKLKAEVAQMRSYKESSDNENIGIQNWSDKTRQKGLEYGKKVEEEFTFYSPLSGNCKQDIPGMVRLNLYARKNAAEIFSPEMNLINVTMDKKNLWRENYQISLPYYRPHNTNSILLESLSAPTRRLWLITAYDTRKSEKNSKALFIDPTNGKVVKELDFLGIPKFSMPVEHEGKIYLSTYDEGILVISRK